MAWPVSTLVSCVCTTAHFNPVVEVQLVMSAAEMGGQSWTCFGGAWGGGARLTLGGLQGLGDSNGRHWPPPLLAVLLLASALNSTVCSLACSSGCVFGLQWEKQLLQVILLFMVHAYSQSE
jgi:hypothetical protein